MIMDSSLLLDDKAPITVTRPSTNVIDIGANRDIGIGERDLDLLIQATTAIAGPGTIQMQWQGSLDGATFNTIIETRAFPIGAGIPAGRKFLASSVPRQSPDPDNISATMYRYFRVNYVVAGGNITAGAITASIVLERDDQAFYPKNYTINA